MHKFTSKSVIIDGNEYFYSRIRNIVFHNSNPAVYTFDYGGKIASLTFDPKDIVVFKIFERLKEISYRAESGQTIEPDEAVIAPEMLKPDSPQQQDDLPQEFALNENQPDIIEKLLKEQLEVQKKTSKSINVIK